MKNYELYVQEIVPFMGSSSNDFDVALIDSETRKQVIRGVWYMAPYNTLRIEDDTRVTTVMTDHDVKHHLLDALGRRIAAYTVTKPDMVNHPPHYQLLPGVEVYDVRMALLAKVEAPAGQVDDWSRAWEYLTRMWQKNGLEDAKKCRWYLDKLIEKMEQ